MQIVRHNQSNMHPIFDQIEMLYKEISDNNRKSGLISSKYCPGFKTLDNILSHHIWSYVPLEYGNTFEKVEVKEQNPRNIVVCISGGKDSLAVAQHLKECGMNVYLYHMRFINKVYPDEWKWVECQASLLDLPLHIEKNYWLTGNHKFVEHPMKNMIIANGALQYAITNNIGTKIAFGNFSTSHLEDSPFEICAGDCVEMWKAYKDIIRSVYPQFVIYNPLCMQADTFAILGCDTKLLPYSHSCISPYRFQNFWHKRTYDTFKGLKLWQGRCGCCWKDAVEYIYCVDHNIQALHREYYIHCIEILSKTIQKEAGRASRRVLDVWERYFFYSFEQSKLYEELKYATIQSNKVKIYT